MTKGSLNENKRWKKGRVRELDLLPRISMSSGASDGTSMRFSFLHHKNRDNIYGANTCQDKLIKMYVRESSIGLSKD